MGDMKNPGRGTPLPHGEDNDPFAELADMFEAELAMDSRSPGGAGHRYPQGADRASAATGAPRTHVDAAGRHAPLAPHDQDFDAAFEAALGHEFAEPAAPARSSRQGLPPATPQAADAYQGWIVPRGARPASVEPARPAATGATTVAHGRSSYSGGRSLGADLETAIHGLSAPANPRDVIVVETQSFAPERVVDDYRHEAAQPELDEFDELIASELAVMKEPIHGANHAYPAFYQQNAGAAQSVEAGDPAGAFDDGYYAEDEPHAAAPRSSFRRTAVTLGGGALSLALIGTVGMFLWGGGGSGGGLQASNEPLLIKADAEPFKTVPKDPGGRMVPNQNKAVYNRVNGSDSQPGTTQQALLTDAEEPMDLPVEEEPAAYADLPGVEPVGTQPSEPDASQARLASAESVAPMPVLQPRKVRTMSVRPDGTIVPAEPEPAAAAAPTVAATPSAPVPPVRVVDASATPTVAPPTAAAATTAPVRQADAAPARQAVAEPATNAPAEVADPIEVAAIAPQQAPAAAMPAGGYFVQISSQPSEAAAQQSMRSLGTKFANVISGRPVGIQAAEIPGKGTFYRVRVAASSKDEASEICGRLKAAGGNCFVAR